MSVCWVGLYVLESEKKVVVSLNPKSSSAVNNASSASFITPSLFLSSNAFGVAVYLTSRLAVCVFVSV